MHDRHRRTGVTSRLRLRDHDYANPGMYFVTLCTEHRACLIGEVNDGQMELSIAGRAIESWWETLAVQFPMLTLDAVVVMPNNLHGLIAFEDEAGMSLSNVIKWFKGRSTNDYIRGVRLHHLPPFSGRLWQPGFYDHIVRSDAALTRIRAYIAANPSRWPWDDENPNRMEWRPRAQGPGLPEETGDILG